MEREFEVPFTYEGADVSAAQWLRLLYSRRLRALLIVALGAAAVLLIELSGLRSQPASPRDSWSTPIAVGAVFVLLVALAYLLAPLIEYRVNSGWRAAVTLRVTPESLRLTRPSTAAGFDLPWPQVTGMLENEEVWLLFFGSDQDFLIVPKRIFGDENQRTFFRGQLANQGFAPRP
jgi:hypothetical protein